MITGQSALVLAQCAAPVYLNLGHNQIGATGAERIAGVLSRCPALTHLNIRHILIGDTGAESFEGVLGQCTMHNAGSPQSQRQSDEHCRGREASCFVVWTSLRPYQKFFLGTLHCLLVCLLCSRQATRKNDILYTYSVVVFGLVLSR